MKKTISLLVTFLVCSSLLANNKLPNYKISNPKEAEWFAENPSSLPIWMTEDELNRIDEIGRDFEPTDPPPAPIRNIAEFNRMQGVLIRYPLGIPVSLVAEMSENVTVTTIVANTFYQNQATNSYQNAGANMDNCNFLIAPTDTYWTRDYGPWFIVDGNNEFGIVNFPYNRPRPNDDDIPIEVAEFLDINLFGMNLISTGGNYMTGGLGISASTELIWDENPTLTHEEVAGFVDEYLGINTYHVVPDPNNTYIDHIDCWGKFLDVDKVLIRSVPETHPQYDELEETADYFAEQISAYGNNYQIYRVFTPNNEPYTNSLILNKKVLLPITGSSYDDDAIATYEQAMPGYEIIGFTGSWASTDALHCRTKGIADLGTLWIEHYPILGEAPVQDEYLIEAEIISYSGEPILPDSTKVFYRINGGDFTSINMNFEGGNSYSAYIPAPSIGSQVAYYIHTADESGRIENDPFIGTPDPFTFFVGEQLFPDISVDTLITVEGQSGTSTDAEFLISNDGELGLNFSLSYTTAIEEEIEYNVPDSPSPSSYNYNTYTENGWLDYDIVDSGEIANISLDFHWATDNWPQEGSFLLESPSGTQVTIGAGLSSGNYSINIDAFDGEELNGTWKIWIEDSYGDGGHQATNIQLTATILLEQEEWLEVSPISGTVEPSESQTIYLTCDATQLPVGDYEGNIEITSNDPDEAVVNVTVQFEVSPGQGIDGEVITFSQLLGNFPNPFTNSTKINYSIAKSNSDVLVEIFNIKGQLVKTLVNETAEFGVYQKTWDGKNNYSNPVSAGIYFYQLKVNGVTKSIKKCLLIN